MSDDVEAIAYATLTPPAAVLILREIPPGEWRRWAQQQRAVGRSHTADALMQACAQLERSAAALVPQLRNSRDRTAEPAASSERGCPPRRLSGPAAGLHVSTAGAAEALGMTDRGVRKAIDEGRLPATKVGRSWRIHPDDISEHRLRSRT